MHRYLIPVLLGAALTSACAGSYGATATLSTPDLVYVGPGVYAVASFSEPVFYADNYYWRFHSGAWYRSSYFDRGWYYEPRPPVRVLGIERPYARYYRDRGRVHIDYRYRPTEANRPAVIYRSRTVERSESPRVIYRERKIGSAHV